MSLLFFFFQAEDGIRDVAVTGVQTCALPISLTDDPGPRGPHGVCPVPERRRPPERAERAAPGRSASRRGRHPRAPARVRRAEDGGSGGCQACGDRGRVTNFGRPLPRADGEPCRGVPCSARRTHRRVQRPLRTSPRRLLAPADPGAEREGSLPRPGALARGGARAHAGRCGREPGVAVAAGRRRATRTPRQPPPSRRLCRRRRGCGGGRPRSPPEWGRRLAPNESPAVRLEILSDVPLAPVLVPAPLRRRSL